MKFKTNSPAEPDINLIPFIDVLLVVLIFLMLTTTWSKFNEMNLSLPTANANTSVSSTPAWVVAVSAQGNYTVNGVRVEGRSAQDIGAALQKLTQADAALVINQNRIRKAKLFNTRCNLQNLLVTVRPRIIAVGY